MPARKPMGLSVEHLTKAARSQRVAGESMLQPKTKLSNKPPAVLTDHPVARRKWKEMIGMYDKLEAPIISALDQDILKDYCMLIEECQETGKLRTAAMREFWRAQAAFELKMQKAKIEPKELAKLLGYIYKTIDVIVGLDARSDRKINLLLTLSQSLYLTPRSRAGVAPDEKPPEKPKSEMAELLDDVN